MVAVIKTSNSIKNALHYNENKLKQGVAQLIHSSGFGRSTERLGFTDKIKTLEKLISLNERTKLNSVHISLNFDPSEKLGQEKLIAIADKYMERIGFGKQPYLVYEHHDAGHPHLHIVTTNIQRNGKGISMYNIGRNKSEKARKEIELEFKLVQAEGHQIKQSDGLRPVNVQKVQYGKSDTRRAITNVLDNILPTYKYSSLPELNAVLRPYNIIADNGKKGSRLNTSNGLLYRILNDKGEPIGIPIKASLIHNKPTLKFLNEVFERNREAKQKFKLRVKNAVDLSFIRHPKQSMNAFVKNLERENIEVLLRQNDQQIIYGITYIDHDSKSVFNGSELGKSYSANQIKERCTQEQSQKSRQILGEQPNLEPAMSQSQHNDYIPGQGALKEIMYDLIKEENEGSLPRELREDEHTRKRKRLRH